MDTWGKLQLKNEIIRKEVMCERIINAGNTRLITTERKEAIYQQNDF